MEDKKINTGDVKGIARKLDELGRVTLPIEYRKELDMLSDERQWVEIYLLKDGIFIKKKDFDYKK